MASSKQAEYFIKIGNKSKTLREVKSVTTSELAEDMEILEAQLIGFESGDFTDFYFSGVLRIAEKLGVTIEEIVNVQA